MALALPIRAFIQDYCQRAFPTKDFGRGSAANDLIIKAYTGLMQPIRHEIDMVKVNQSISNWQVMRREDLDAISSNWGRFRQTGSTSSGVVRLYFSTVANYSLSNLVFYTADGTTFNLSAPISITTADLYARRLADGTFYYDVAVQSVGVGNSYAIPAGAIIGVQNPPPGIIRVENPTDFSITSPDQSNFDVVNAMFKSIGLQNLVGRASTRAPLLDNYPGITDLFIAGVGDPQMVRDLVTIVSPAGNILVHLGGLVDIWLNTKTTSQQQLTISYLPSSQQFNIVSEDQAQANELVFAFQRGILTIEGLFWNPDSHEPQLDESVAFSFDQDTIPVTGFVVGSFGVDRFETANQDLVAGSELFVLPGRNGVSSLVGDLFGISFAQSNLQVGDILYYGENYRRVTGVGGRLLDVSPSIQNVVNATYVGAQLPAGTLTIPLTSIGASARVNDRLVVPEGAAAGMYQVLAVATNSLMVGLPLSEGAVVHAGTDLNPNVQVFQYRNPTGGPPHHPATIGTQCYLYFGSDDGYTPAHFFPITSVVIETLFTEIHIYDPGNVAQTLGSVAQIISGLVGVLPQNSFCIIERDDQAVFEQSPLITFPTNHTKYVSELPSILAATTTTLSATGIGATADVGDLIVFYNPTIPDANVAATGGDGTRCTVLIDQVLDQNTVVTRPALPFDVAAGTRFSVMRNSQSISSAAVSAVDLVNNVATFSSFPLGLGDGLGLFLKYAGEYYTVLSSQVGAVVTLTFAPPVSVIPVTLNSGSYTAPTPASKGKSVQQITGAATYNGVLYDYDNTGLIWYIIPNNPGTDLFDGVGYQIQVFGGQGVGTEASFAGAQTQGYTGPVAGDIGLPVRQGAYNGTLISYDNGTFTWVVQPETGGDLFDNESVLTFVDLGGDTPSVGHGQGTTNQTPAASSFVGGPASVTLDRPITFAATDTVDFFSRFGFLGTNFSLTSAITYPDNTLNPPTNLSTVDPSSDVLQILAGADQDTYTVSTAAAQQLGLAQPQLPDVVRIANAPPATPFSLLSTLPAGATTISQTNIGIYGGIGRCVLIVGPGGQQLLPIIDVLDQNDVMVGGGGTAFAIAPSAGYTWEIVEALHLPYWVTPTVALTPYRLFRPPAVVNILQQSATGTVADANPTQFSDINVAFGALLQNADFTDGDVLLYIDGGDYAQAAPFQVLGIVSANTINLDQSANFTTNGSAISYRLVIKNNAPAQEIWYEGVVLPPVAGMKNQISIIAAPDDDISITRYDSENVWDVDIVPHAGWNNAVPVALPNNWTMPRFRIASFNTLTDAIRLLSTVYGAAENLAVTTTSGVITPASMTGGSTTEFAMGGLLLTGIPASGDQVVINTSAQVLQLEFNNGTPTVGYIAVPIGLTISANVTNLINAILSLRPTINAFPDRVMTLDSTAGHYGAIQGTDNFDAGTGIIMVPGDKVRVMLRVSDRTQSTQLSGTAINTYNYYGGNYFQLPVVQIVNVELLDPVTLQPLRTLDYSLAVLDEGLRYSAIETNRLEINDETAVFQPIRVTYTTDPTIGTVNDYVLAQDTKVLAQAQLVKRMETITVDVQISVRTTLTAPQVAAIIASFINSKRSTSALTKPDIIKALFANTQISYIDIASFVMNAVYYPYTGVVTPFTDVDEVFGAVTAGYLANNISVTKL